MTSAAKESVLQFWNERAALGVRAGTNDFVLTGLEQQFLRQAVERGSRVLDIGCGNGSSLRLLAGQKGCVGVGVDYSAEMIKVATASAREEGLADALAWHQRSLPPVPNEWGPFDVAYSQRCLINLSSTEEQRDAVLSVQHVLKAGGCYFMIECFEEGAEETNLLRRRLDLAPLEAPWHNLFFQLHTVRSWSTPEFYVERVLHISSTYHFLSRVVNASLCADTGEELRYDAPINMLAARLPQDLGEFGPVKACIWRKAAGKE